ncbi:MAG TPA: hypothetical protein VJ507_02745 [Candidatus Bathyarchaeia archaeon]|nr:hypothetical protein [Candidatus Bathyarchaeia archaeon]
MDGRGRFEQDLSTLMLRLAAGMEKESEIKLSNLRDWLLKLQRENVVKINHSVMELVCAKYLILKGYDVQLEYGLNDLLTCDLYSTKGYGNLIVEIETGFIPPDHALDPLTYLSARLASKIIRYSSFAGKFALGVPPHYVLSFPNALAKPPRRRTPDEVERVKKLCDLYYNNPPVTEEEILNARIHEIYLIDVDRGKVLEIDPEAYMKRALHKEYSMPLNGEENIQQPKPTTLFDFQEKLEGTEPT